MYQEVCEIPYLKWLGSTIQGIRVEASLPPPPSRPWQDEVLVRSVKISRLEIVHFAVLPKSLSILPEFMRDRIRVGGSMNK